MTPQTIKQKLDEINDRRLKCQEDNDILGECACVREYALVCREWDEQLIAMEETNGMFMPF